MAGGTPEIATAQIGHVDFKPRSPGNCYNRLLLWQGLSALGITHICNRLQHCKHRRRLHIVDDIFVEEGEPREAAVGVLICRNWRRRWQTASHSSVHGRTR